LVVVDNRVDPATATVQLKARFANAQRHLWPGQLLNVKLTLQTVRNVLALPTVAVNQGPKGSFVYVIEDNKAILRPLEVELGQDEITVARSGVEPGDTVVVEGQGSLRPGAKVRVRPAPASATATAPSPTPAPDPRPVPVLAQPNAAPARVPGLE
jgi:multidrug efflux system membrane fusion protein